MHPGTGGRGLLRMLSNSFISDVYMFNLMAARNLLASNVNQAIS